MPIKAPEPKVVAPTESKTYPDLWFSPWVFDQKSPEDQGWLKIDKRYHNAETGEMLAGSEGDAGSIYYDNLVDLMTNVPEAAAAYGALMAAIPAIEAYIADQNAEPEVAEEPPVEDPEAEE